MRYINRYKNFKLVNESLEKEKNDEFLPDLFDILMDLYDIEYDVMVQGETYRFRLKSYIDGGEGEKSEILSNFKPIYKAGNKIRSNFEIRIAIGKLDYKKVNYVTSEMLVINNRLSDLGWRMINFEVEKVGSTYPGSIPQTIWLSHKFEKPTITITGEKIPDKNEISDALYDISNLELEEYTIDGDKIFIGADSPFTIDGLIDISDEKLEKICNILGFKSAQYELTNNNTWVRIIFWVN